MSQPGSFTSLDEWLPWLESLSPREIVLGLDRVQLVLGRLDLQTPDIVIHIAGTNGKGSSAALLEALLRQAGIATGCYTSPHLNHYNERIRIDGLPASDDAVMHALERVEAVRDNVPLTFFEFGTLAAVAAFDSANVGAWILEVGLGGRLDAVNAMEPDVSLITNISLDHCAWLGDDIESIASEKAGIMRTSKPVVFASPTVPDAIPHIAGKLGAKLILAKRDFSHTSDSEAGGDWSWHGKTSRLANLVPPAQGGEIQLENASAVLAVLEALEMNQVLTTATVNAALGNIDLAGRFQIAYKHCRWVLDVAHNPDAASVLAKQLDEHCHSGITTAVVGMLQDKDIAGIIAPLKDQVDRWIAVTVNGTRAESATALAMQIANLAMPDRG